MASSPNPKRKVETGKNIDNCYGTDSPQQHMDDGFLA